MIAYEIQLQYVIRDKIQSETKSQNFFLLEKRICQKKKILGFPLGLNFVSDFQCTFELSQTNRCL